MSELPRIINMKIAFDAGWAACRAHIGIRLAARAEREAAFEKFYRTVVGELEKVEDSLWKDRVRDI